MRALLRKALRVTIGAKLWRAIEMRRARRHSVEWLEREGVIRLALTIAEKFDFTVQQGPFQGMRYTRDAIVSRHATPCLLGTYERQLYPSIVSAASRCELVIDVGSADGYFAVGLARLTRKPVYAFDVDPSERLVLKGMAAENSVGDLVQVSDWCAPETLIRLASGRPALVFCDIDGGEFALFTPEVLKAIAQSQVIVELHGTSEENAEFVSRFSDRESMVLEHPKDCPGAQLLPFVGDDAERMATEYRQDQQWLVASSKVA